MASDDSTRTDFDLSPWQGIDPLSLFQAAWLWAGIPPTLPETQENELRYSVPLASARGLFGRLEKAAKAGKPPILGDAPTKQKLISRAVWGSKYLGNQSQPAVYQTVPADDWRDALVALADLRAFVESTGQRPAFFFPEMAAALTGNSPGAGWGASNSMDAKTPEKWSHGIRSVAFDAAKIIVANSGKLTADGLEKAMLTSGKVELKNGEYQLKSTDGSLNEREMKAKPKTIAGWVTELKKQMK
jgi:hypothetical protein